MRAALFFLLVIAASEVEAEAATILNFDGLPSSTAFKNGSAVPAADQLSNQYVGTNGILFSSASPYVGVVNVGSMAPTPPNSIAGVTGGNVDLFGSSCIQLLESGESVS